MSALNVLADTFRQLEFMRKEQLIIVEDVIRDISSRILSVNPDVRLSTGVNVNGIYVDAVSRNTGVTLEIEILDEDDDEIYDTATVSILGNGLPSNKEYPITLFPEKITGLIKEHLSE